MADLGAISLWIALALAAYSTVGSVAGKLRLSPALVESAQSAMYAAGLALMVATLSLVVAFISRDFEIAYVAAHSDLAMANKFTWVAFYAGNEGSLLYIATILSIMSSIAVWRAPEKFKDALPYTTAILMLTLTFFVAVMAVMANPFDKLPFVPLDGDGINPLLTHFGMFFHPPALMAGLIGITVPFAFAIGSLLAGKTGDEWVDAGRVWGMVSWVLLAGGLLLGSWWAYTILGWGGFWFWDPVENASFMPWLISVALLHCAIVVEKREALKSWTILLAILAFGFSLIGTFIVRSGVLTSVHAFASDPERGVFILAIMAVFIGGALVLFALRAGAMEAKGVFSIVSRESALVLNNILLGVASFVVFTGTLWPLIAELFFDRKLSVGPPFFDAAFTPFMVALAIVMPIGALMPWKRAKLGKAMKPLWPVLVLALSVGALVWAMQTGQSALGPVGAMLAIWVAGGAAMDIWARAGRGSLSNRLGRLTRLPRADWGRVVAHGGLCITMIGIAGLMAWDTEDIRVANIGDSFEVAGLTVSLNDVYREQGPNFVATVADMSVTRNGRLIAELKPEKRVYPVAQMPTTEAAIKSGLMRDIYLVIGDQQANGGWAVRTYVKPLALWLWGGAIIMAFGGVLSLTDRRFRIAAGARRRSKKANMVAAE